MITDMIMRIISMASAEKTIAGKKAVLLEGFTGDRSFAVLLRTFIHHVLDPSWNYYMTKAQLPEPEVCYSGRLFSHDFQGMLELLLVMHNREIRGAELKNTVAHWLYYCDPALRALFTMAIERKLPGNIGRTIVNAVAPDLIYKQPYCGCCSWNADTVHKRFDFKQGVLWQVKEDGMTLLVDTRERTIRTRQGQDVTQQMTPYVNPIFWNFPDDKVIHFEAKMWDAKFRKMLPRPLANGKFNKIFQGVLDVNPARIVLVGLDMVDAVEFYGEHEPAASCMERYQTLEWAVCDYNSQKNDTVTGWPEVKEVKCTFVYSLKEARQLTQEQIAAGGEGAIIKDPLFLYRITENHPGQMKMKNEFEMTLCCVDTKPHKKHPEWVGSLLMRSLDGANGKVILSYVGSGLNEDPDSPLNRTKGPAVFIDNLYEIKAEKISKNNALDLPRVVELRTDKDDADTYEDVLAAYNDSVSLKEAQWTG